MVEGRCNPSWQRITRDIGITTVSNVLSIYLIKYIKIVWLKDFDRFRQLSFLEIFLLVLSLHNPFNLLSDVRTFLPLLYYLRRNLYLLYGNRR